jgi:CheY-like chemotaxis protein
MRCEWRAILIVEDDPNDGELISLALEDLGIPSVIQRVSSGTEAMSYLEGEGQFADRSIYPYPSCVITDLKMNDGDGYSVLEYLKNLSDRKIIPVLVFSGSSDSDDIKHAYLLGASCYLVKPSSFDELRRLLKAFHDFWIECAMPQIEDTGRWTETVAHGKLGARLKH